MATFPLDGGTFLIHFVNHSNTEINYDLRAISGDQTNYGNIAPGARAQSTSWDVVGTVEYGEIAVVGIGQFGRPQLVPPPGVRFWSGTDRGFLSQYINLLAGNGWNVTRNTSLLSEVIGNRFRVTVDAGGNPQSTGSIDVQVYNA